MEEDIIKKDYGFKHAQKLLKDGCDIIDIGGEATNPGSKEVHLEREWEKFPNIIKLKKLKKNFLSLDTRKSVIMKRGIKNKINLINDVSGLEYDSNTIKILKDTNIPFVIHHTLR